MKPEERKFIDIALEMGYLDHKQANSICTVCDYYDRHGHDVGIIPILVQRGYLQQEQIAALLQILGEKESRELLNHTKGAQPQAGQRQAVQPQTAQTSQQQVSQPQVSQPQTAQPVQKRQDSHPMKRTGQIEMQHPQTPQANPLFQAQTDQVSQAQVSQAQANQTNQPQCVQKKQTERHAQIARKRQTTKYVQMNPLAARQDVPQNPTHNVEKQQEAKQIPSSPLPEKPSIPEKDHASEASGRTMTKPFNIISLDGIAKGKMWKDYEVIDKIGSGGMAEVFKAKQRSPDRIVALKILSPHEMSAEKLARFIKEAQVSARLEHPNIVKIYRAEVHEQIPFIAMAYIDGVSLDQYYKIKHPSLEEFLSILEKIAYALHYAHEEKIIHRDIKPANILIDKNGTPFLMDFGIARTTNIEEHNLTMSGQVLGTPKYMSPEQAAGDIRELDRRTDIYSMGAILYEFVTRRPPVQGNSVVELLYHLVNTPLVPPSAIVPDVPERLESIILKAMAYEKTKRYNTAQELGQEIRDFLQSKTKNAQRPLDRLKTRARLLQYWIYQNKTVVSLFSVILVISVVLFYILSRPGEIKVYKKNSAEIETLWNKADSAFKQKRYNESLRVIEDILINKHDHKNALMLKSQILAIEQKWEEMRLTWITLLEISAKDLECLQFIGKQAMNYGYWEEASRYLAKALSLSPNSQEIRKNLAQSLLKEGKYKDAAEVYHSCNSKSPDVLWGIASVRYQLQEMDNAQSILEQIFSSHDVDALDSDLRSEILFLRARVKWELYQTELSRWEWLLSELHPQTQYMQIASGLELIAGDLRQAMSLNPDYHEIKHYYDAIQLEMTPFRSCNSTEPLQNFLQKLPEEYQKEHFFQKLVVRFLIRQEKWKEAKKLCSTLIAQSPWQPDLYYFRCVAGFYLREIDQAMDDFQKTVKLDTTNFIAVETMIWLMLTSFTQEEYYLFLRVVYLYLQNMEHPIETLLFKKRLSELKQEYFPKQILNRRSKNLSSLESMFGTVVESSSSEARKVASAGITMYSGSSELQEKLKETKNKFINDPAKTKRLLDLEELLERYKKLEELKALKRTLIQYSVLKEDRYALKVRMMKETGEENLKKIYENESEDPVLRFLALRMSMALRKPHIYSQIRELSVGTKYPLNLMATSAIRETGIPQPMPQIDITKESNVLYRALYAWYLDPVPESNHATCKNLLDDENDYVVLYAAFNFRRYEELAPYLQENLTQKLIQMIRRKSSPDIRYTACRVFWNFRSLGTGNNRNRNVERFRENMCVKTFSQHYQTLVEILKDPVFEVRLGGITASFGDGYIRREGKERLENPEIMDEMEKALQSIASRKDEPYWIKFWSSGALGLWSRNKVGISIIKDSSASFATRVGAIFGIFQGRAFEALPEILLFIGSKSQTFEDSALKQLFILTLAQLGSTTYPAMKEYIHKQLKVWIKSPDIFIQKGAVASLLWCGKKDAIKMVQPFLDSPDLSMKRAAALTIASLASQYEPKSIPFWHQKMKNQPLPVQKAYAFGYYHTIYSKTFVPHQFSYEKWYSIYAERMEKRADEDYVFFFDNAGEAYPEWYYFYEAGLVYAKFKKFDTAIKQAEKAIQCLSQEMTSDYGNDSIARARCFMLIARLYSIQNQPAEALKYWEKALQEAPFDPRPSYEIATIIARQGQKEKAIEYYSESYLCEPESSQPLLAIANTFAEKRDPKSAILTLQFANTKFRITKSDFVDYPALKNIKDDPWIKSLPEGED